MSGTVAAIFWADRCPEDVTQKDNPDGGRAAACPPSSRFIGHGCAHREPTRPFSLPRRKSSACCVFKEGHAPTDSEVEAERDAERSGGRTLADCSIHQNEIPRAAWLQLMSEPPTSSQ